MYEPVQDPEIDEAHDRVKGVADSLENGKRPVFW
jgi:hypothetical protein